MQGHPPPGPLTPTMEPARVPDLRAPYRPALQRGTGP